MLIAFLGGVGSGKSLSMTREIVIKAVAGETTYCNYPISYKNVIRLKRDNVLKEAELQGKQQKRKLIVNWDFWQDKTGFNICIDEIHNLMHSRRPSSNVNMCNWVAQIRKILGENEDYNFYFSSQIMERIDLALRDLTTEVIFCEAWYQMRVSGGYKWVKKNIYNRMYKKQGYKVRSIPTKIKFNDKLIVKDVPLTNIVQYHFIGVRCIEKFHTWEFTGEKTFSSRDSFIGNTYMRYYNSYERIRFGEDVYL